MAVTYPTKIILAMKSGGRCAFKECGLNLTTEGLNSGAAIIGEAAHIYGEHEGAARFNAALSKEKVNHYDNLIYLCPTCHTIIDKNEKDYSPELLLDLKKAHEKWISQQLDEKMSDVTFAELEIASKAIATGQHFLSTGFSIITPAEKISKNLLSKDVMGLIITGLSRSGEVTTYLRKQAQLDYDFPERLRNGFKRKYLELKQKYTGDELFFGIFDFATNGQHDFKQQAASLAIMVHLFHICEIFEK